MSFMHGMPPYGYGYPMPPQSNPLEELERTVGWYNRIIKSAKEEQEKKDKHGDHNFRGRKSNISALDMFLVMYILSVPFAILNIAIAKSLLRIISGL